ncbi:MAG TPA: hypothetical protein VN622_04160 [Clostridia bacterium]|nr:hypothetical protein [Clostridia bacterium]
MALVKAKGPLVPATVGFHADSNSYTMSFQAERFHKSVRFYWMICGTQNPDELVSWGHAQTQELAEAAAQKEVNDLISGLTECGLVKSAVTAFTRR